MTHAVTKESCAALYDFLCTLPPFCDWNMPDSEDVIFKVTRSRDTGGYHKLWMRGRKKDAHEIGVSSFLCGWVDAFIRVMAHEMIHLHQEERGMGSPHTMHNTAFKLDADIVAKMLGFDPNMFV